MANVGDVVIRLRADTAQFRAQMERGSKSLKQFGDRAKKTGEQLRDIGTRISLGITAPLAALAAVTVSSANTFEKEVTKINTLVGISADQVEKWDASIRALGPSTGVGPAELAKAMFVVTSAGARGANALAILDNAARASAVGLGDTASVARTVTSAIQAYGVETLNAERATEILVATVREGNLEAAQLAGSLGRVIGIASQVGVSFSDLGGFIATFTRLGVSAEESVTALRGLLATIIKPGNEAKEALTSVGLSVEGLQRSIRVEGLAKTLLDLKAAFAGNTNELAKVIPNIRALSGFLGVTGQQAEQFVRITNSISESQGILSEAFQTTVSTGASAFERFKSLLEGTSIAVGQALVPAFVKLLDVLTPVLEGVIRLSGLFADLPVEIQAFTLGIVGLVAALGPLVFIIGSLISAFGAMASAIGTLLGSSALLGLVGFLGPTGLLVIGITAALGAIALIIAAMNKWTDATKATKEAIKDLTRTELADELREIADDIAGLDREIQDAKRELSSGTMTKTARERMGIQSGLNRLTKERFDLLGKQKILMDAIVVASKQELATENARNAAQAAKGAPGAPTIAPVDTDRLERIADIISDLDASLTVARVKFDAFGNATVALQDQLSANMAAFEGLAAEGVDPASAKMVELKDNIIDLQNELIKLEGTSGALPLSAVKTVMDELDEATRRARVSFQLFGDRTTLNSELLAAQTTALQRLVALGLDPADAKVQDLAASITMLKKEDFSSELRKFSGAFSGFVGDVVKGSESIGDAFARLGQRIISTLSDIAIQRAATGLVGDGGKSSTGGLLGTLFGAAIGALGSLGGGAAASGNQTHLGVGAGTKIGVPIGGSSGLAAVGRTAAEGKVVRGATVMEVGHGRFGEVIAPLEKLPGLMQQAMGNQGPGGAGNTVVNMTVNTADARSFNKNRQQIMGDVNRAAARGRRVT